jgi:hypothetical protein
MSLLSQVKPTTTSSINQVVKNSFQLTFTTLVNLKFPSLSEVDELFHGRCEPLNGQSRPEEQKAEARLLVNY